MCHCKSDKRLRTLATPKNVLHALVELKIRSEVIGYTMEHTGRDDESYLTVVFDTKIWELEHIDLRPGYGRRRIIADPASSS